MMNNEKHEGAWRLILLPLVWHFDFRELSFNGLRRGVAASIRWFVDTFTVLPVSFGFCITYWLSTEYALLTKFQTYSGMPKAAFDDAKGYLWHRRLRPFASQKTVNGRRKSILSCCERPSDYGLNTCSHCLSSLHSLSFRLFHDF